MPVDSTRTDYNYQLNIWRKCRDVVAGQEAMHCQGTLYLQRLSGQTDNEYRAYVERALFYNATQRTVDAMRGLLFRKEPITVVPKAILPWLDDIDMNGNSLNNYVEDIASEILIVGRYGLLVEHPQIVVNDENSVYSKADIENQNIRPFFAKYTAENIINWRVSTLNNQKTLSLVVLREYYENDIDGFSCSDDVQYRVLDIDPNSGNYRQRLYRPMGEKKEMVLISETIPMKNGNFIKFIPFIMISPKGISYDIAKPPILDLVNVNISHYKTTADLEHGAHYTGLPTAVVTGHGLGANKMLKIGSSEAWVFSEPEAKAFYLEFSGTGLEALERRLEKKENQMATLGARMLASEKASSETAEAHTIKRQGENAALTSIATAIEVSIIKALIILCDWVNVTGDIDYQINKDFVPTAMDAQHILALLQLFQAGTIGYSDFIENLKKGEIIDSEKTPESIKDEVDSYGVIGGNFNQPV